MQMEVAVILTKKSYSNWFRLVSKASLALAHFAEQRPDQLARAASSQTKDGAGLGSCI